MLPRLHPASQVSTHHLHYRLDLVLCMAIREDLNNKCKGCQRTQKADTMQSRSHNQ
jgi:hypothetical protein